ncbi:unnamed protein product [Rhizophagus irregularis]|nr:unnamed protein product [Rhizophagus irregularis]
MIHTYTKLPNLLALLLILKPSAGLKVDLLPVYRVYVVRKFKNPFLNIEKERNSIYIKDSSNGNFFST